MTLERHIPSTALFATAREPAESSLGSGLAHLLQPVVSSQLFANEGYMAPVWLTLKFRALVNVHRVSPLRVYSTGDRPEVNEQEFFHIAKSEDGTFQPTLLLVGTRLGIDRITAGYWEGLLASFQMPQSVGIAGGRPSSSHYFVGTQGEYLFYLDPHHTRRALPYRDDPATYEDSEVDSCHTTRLRRLHIKDMDPSMLIGFLIRHEGDWHDWKNRLCAINGMAPVTVSEHLRHERGFSTERASAIDEVESLSDGDDKDALA
jgi:cysteine protease ATG4